MKRFFACAQKDRDAHRMARESGLVSQFLVYINWAFAQGIIGAGGGIRAADRPESVRARFEREKRFIVCLKIAKRGLRDDRGALRQSGKYLPSGAVQREHAQIPGKRRLMRARKAG